MRALLVIDYQTDFVTGSLGSDAAASIEDNIAERISEYRRTGDAVFFTMDTHHADYPDTNEGRFLPVAHCVEGTPGWKIHGKIGVLAEGCKVFVKSSFADITVAKKLREFDDIELCGVATNICVMSNAVMLRSMYPETRITIREDCVASYDSALHEKALDVMESANIIVLRK